VLHDLIECYFQMFCDVQCKVKLYSIAAMLRTNEVATVTKEKYNALWKTLETYESVVKLVSLFEVSNLTYSQLRCQSG
jgi:hypothetical protein